MRRRPDSDLHRLPLALAFFDGRPKHEALVARIRGIMPAARERGARR